jgi:dienelactone hydrolase
MTREGEHMNLIIVSDIFGRTTSIDRLIRLLSPLYGDVSLIEPYAGERIDFQDEAEAYRHFQQHCGSEKLTALLLKKVAAAQTAVDLVGFSVGATAVWELSANDCSQKMRQVAAFYGSRIREKTDITPKVPTTLIFPAKEEGFNLDQVIQCVENKRLVEIIRTGYLHGFMNCASCNFSYEGSRIFSDWLTNFRFSGRDLRLNKDPI